MIEIWLHPRDAEFLHRPGPHLSAAASLKVRRGLLYRMTGKTLRPRISRV